MKATREILLVTHSGRAHIVETARRVAKILKTAGMLLRVPAGEAAGAELLCELCDGVSGQTVAPSADAAAGCEMVLVLGGDGSMLRAAEYARAASVPVLGINLGRIGFLTEAEADHLDEALTQVVDGDYRVEHRMSLDVTVRVDDMVIDRGWALNEASIENESRLGVLEVTLEVDDRPVSSFGCDGILVATPTGSTAYAFSAGGPVVWPQLEAILVIPSNAHALFARPLVTSPDSVIAVQTVASGHHAIAYLDGRRTVRIPHGGRVEVVRGSDPVLWVRLDSAPFADRLVRKFDLPVRGWRPRQAR